MPVFEQSYARWTPGDGSRVRWWPIVRREIQLLLAQRVFRILLIVAAMPTLVSLLQIYSVNKLAADPDSELARALRTVSIVIDGEFFFQFLQIQTYFVFVLLLYASSGLVCDDIRLNLVEVYFSKPLTVRDYLIGKITTLLGLGFLYTAVPALFLFAAQLMMSPGSDFWARHHGIPLASVAFSAVIVVPTTMATLACSALTSSRGFAAAAVIAVLAIDGFSATLLAEILGMRSVNIISIPAAMMRAGEWFFGVEPYIPLAGAWALLVVSGVAGLGLVLLRRRIRGVEVGA
jgi:hypothetical protein